MVTFISKSVVDMAHDPSNDLVRLVEVLQDFAAHALYKNRAQCLPSRGTKPSRIV
jgi:hypothetical protein